MQQKGLLVLIILSCATGTYTDRQPLKIQKCRDGVMLYLSEVPTDIDKVIELHLEE